MFLSSGPDRNSYYHEKFLRGLPHLCKDMKRPGVAEKKAADPEHEPDLYKISELHPLPSEAEYDSIQLQSTVQGGPNARVPIYSEALSTAVLPKSGIVGQSAPRDRFVLNAFQQAIVASEDQFRGFQRTSTPAASQINVPSAFFMSAASSPSPFNRKRPTAPANRSIFGISTTSSASSTGAAGRLSALGAANQLALHGISPSSSSLSAAWHSNSSAASQLAADIAAATAFSQHQFRSILGNIARQPNSNNGFQGFR